MPASVAGASTPRVRASSSAVSIRTEPSRWRCSSAFGIEAIRAWIGSVTSRCYDPGRMSSAAASRVTSGLGSLVGPVFGAAAYLILESVLSRLTEHWQAVLGPILILVVLFSKTGLYGIFALPRRRSG